MTFIIAFRSIFRNFRRSLTTMLSIAVGAAAMMVFAGYALYDVYILQTTAVERGGHLAVFNSGYLEFGSGDPSIWGIDDYAGVVTLLKSDPVLARLSAVITPVQYLGGIAENPNVEGSRSFFASGFVPADQSLMSKWDEYGVGGDSGNTGLNSPDPESGVIGFGLARYLGLCKTLHLADCPKPPRHRRTRDRSDVAGLPHQDFSAFPETHTTARVVPAINLIAATAGGAPNIVAMKIGRVERQGAKEMDDGYVVMNLGLAQQLVYGRGEHKVTGILLQLHRTEDIPAARSRLEVLFVRHHLDLEVRDFGEINTYYGQTLGFFQFMFTFIAAIFGVVVLFTVSNTMGMTVMERIDEIGTTRALGARRARIRRQFLLEGSILGAFGATLGVGLAFAVAAAINNAGLTWTPPGDAHAIPFKLYMLGASNVIVGVWLVLIVVATIAAFVPANRAARLPIVDALRHV
jgi:putative ABC transport system permease protein